jgi:hypothetical protein
MPWAHCAFRNVASVWTQLRSAGYAITDNLLIRGTLQVPVVTALHGVQGEHPVAYLALAYDFAL